MAPSTKYPGRVYFYAQNPEDLIAAGYDSLRVERRKDFASPFVKLTKGDKVGELRLAPGRNNYHFTDNVSADGTTGADTTTEYRAVIQNSEDPGTPVDLPQPVQKAVSLDFEMVLTVQELRDIYLWGQERSLVRDDGREIPDYVMVHYIRYGIAKVERMLNISVLPTLILEKHDYMRENGVARGEYLFFSLDQFPVIDIESVALVLPGSPRREYPKEWFRWHADDGQLFLVPSALGVAPSATGVPMSPRRLIPDAYEITYYAGFDPARLPPELKDAVGKEAAGGPLNIGGDLLLGAGIASSSLSLDGLSQSINTTSSATNAGYGARLIQYEKELKTLYKVLLPYYRGLKMRVA